MGKDQKETWNMKPSKFMQCCSADYLPGKQHDAMPLQLDDVDGVII